MPSFHYLKKGHTQESRRMRYTECMTRTSESLQQRRCSLPIIAILMAGVVMPLGSPLKSMSSTVANEQGSWTLAAPAPTPRTEVAVAPLHGKIYVVGGFAKPGLDTFMNLGISSLVEVYDAQTDSWSTTTPLPEGRHHAGIAAYNGKLYVIGGFTKSLFSIWKPVDTVYRFDPTTAEWEELASMPTARGALGVAVLDGRLYAIGGFDGTTNPSAVEIYDPTANSWAATTPIPTPRDHLAVLTVGMKIYAIGGRPRLDYSQNLATVEEYNTHEARWRTKAALPTARSGIAAGVIDRRIFVLGGESDAGTFTTNEMYLPTVDRWQTMAPLPTARHGLGAAVINGRLYAISGGETPGGSFSRHNEVFTPPIP